MWKALVTEKFATYRACVNRHSPCFHTTGQRDAHKELHPEQLAERVTLKQGLFDLA